MKILTKISLSLMLLIALLSCSKKENGAESKYKVGVIQLVEHAALDASYKGFVDALKEAGFEEGVNITIDYQNAQGEQANCVTIAEKFINDKTDLILAIATPAAQAVANLTKDIPILITAVTDAKDAKLVKENNAPGGNVSGTSDLTPVNAQMDLVKTILPNIKTIGFLYCSSEQNSKFQIDMAKKRADEMGIKYIEATVSNPNEIQQVVQSLVGKVDAIYSPTDNMIAAGMATVATVTLPNKIPVFCGEAGMVNAGGVATYGINYYELGKLTGKQAVEILKNGKKPAEMPIETLTKFDLTVNTNTVVELGITIPESVYQNAN